MFASSGLLLNKEPQKIKCVRKVVNEQNIKLHPYLNYFVNQ